MTISRFDLAARKFFGPFFVVGLMGGFVALGLENYGIDHFSDPGTGRPYELVSHGHHFWVTERFWWYHAVAQWAFFLLGFAIILLELGRGIYLFWKNAWS
jgi:hypothetical protein